MIPSELQAYQKHASMDERIENAENWLLTSMRSFLVQVFQEESQMRDQ